MRHNPGEHRHNFRPGVVTAIADRGFWVQPDSRALPQSVSQLSMDPQWIATAPGTATCAELLALGQSKLRCAEWDAEGFHLLFSRLATAGGKASASHGAKSAGGEKAKEDQQLRQMTRPLAPNEKIDLFVSHSWHDDGMAKFSALQEVAEAFKRREGRWPTFWVDALCFDQTDITNSLKLLPVNVAACDTVLVLCGATYCSRLWCVWELYTVFAFAPKQQAIGRIQLQPLVEAASHGQASKRQVHVHVPASLSKFELSGARCYDPNEEGKIRGIIRDCGQASFESHVRELGEALLERAPVVSTPGHMYT